MKTEKKRCVGCNKCIFCCPTNANNALLEDMENKIHVDETMCISCGACIDICDHDARFVEDDTERFLTDLQKGKQISLIAAPSIKHNIEEYERLFGYLKSKGVNVFYDVSLGADITTWGYIRAAQEQNISSMIASPCPVIVEYIERFKPELIASLAPIHSPAICIAIYMKKYMNITDEIAFLSPCLGKSKEIVDENTHGYVGYNITYSGILKHLEAGNIDLCDYEQQQFDNIDGGLGLAFSRPGGLCENIRFYMDDDTWIYQIEGMSDIKEYFDEYARRKSLGKPTPFVVDALNCEQGCNLGTGTLKKVAVDDINYKIDKLKKSLDREKAQELFKYFDDNLRLDDFTRHYTDKSQSITKADAVDIEDVFARLDKRTEEERKINCFSCGFGSCQEFANAVALGKNHIENCLRYSYKKISGQKEVLVAQGVSLDEQKKLLEKKNEELTAAIEYVGQVEESLKVEREINDFAVKTKYELVALLDVDKRILTVYKRSLDFEKGGLQIAGDYDTAAMTVLNNMVHVDDHENFKSLFFDKLIEELNKNGEFVLEYRLGDVERVNYRWKRVLYRYFSNSNNIVIQLTEDIHNDMVIKKELEANNEKLLLHEQCFRALSEHTNKVIFEWDFEANKIIAMTNFNALFGKEAIGLSSDVNETLTIRYIHKDDRALFINAFQTVLSGSAVNDIRFRVKARDGIYHWCSLSGIVIKDKDGNLFKAIGILESIVEQINKEESLRQKAEHDQLTELYNKATSEYLIKNILNNSDTSRRHALMIIDIDNYKNINDRLGHLYGDIVLTQLATALKSIFRESDIIGRIGGDEFFVFLEGYASQEMLARKAAEICKLFRRTYSEGEKRESISASIGIALYPEHGQDFEGLYKSADIALYDVKLSGKNNFKIYNGEKTANYVVGRTDIDSTGENKNRFKENRVEYIFRLLYESDNIGGNINAALQFITEHFGFSRGYIFETDSSGLYTSNTFEWCNDGISPEMDSLQNLPMDILEVANKSFKDTGVFIVADIRELSLIEREVLERQNIKSMLQFGIVKQGEVIGFIGFDDCVHAHTPSNDELEELKLICNVFATFLTKQRASEYANSNYAAMLSILNNFEGYTYVIDKETHEVEFENANTRNIVGKSSVGKYCYKEYMHKEHPCDDCPVLGMSDTVSHSTREMYNKTYDIYTRTTATKINWINGQPKYLISSVDVTEYKR